MIRNLYLDTANLKEINQYVQTDAIAGVTTNPSLMAKETKGDYLAKLIEICETITVNALSRKHLSVEVTTLSPNQMIDQACYLRDNILDKFNQKVDLYVKIPFSAATLPVISRLTEVQVKVNATAIMTALQAKIAEDAGAPIVSFFYNRALDRAVRVDEEIGLFANTLRRSSRIICGSIRKPDDVKKCWMAGADIVTASVKVIEEMVYHPGTEEAIERFQKDIDAWLA